MTALSKADIEKRRAGLSPEQQLLLDSRLRGAPPTQVEPVIPRAHVQGVIPLSYAQERLWLLNEIGGLGSAYNMAAVVRLQGTLDAGALERSFAAFVERHEVLRVRFVTEDGSPGQLVENSNRFELALEDGFENLPHDDRALAVQSRIDALTRQEFDLKNGALFRAYLLRLSAREHLVVVVVHHIVADGWSIGILLRELGSLYMAISQGRTPALPALPVQYADYAVWQRGWLRGDTLDKQVAYWKMRLSGTPAVLDLPSDRQRPTVQSYRGAQVTFEVPTDVRSKLVDLGQREGATLFMVLLTAFKVLLARWSGQYDIVVGSTIAGRTHRELEGLVGFFVNTLALRTDLSGDPSFRDLLARVKETALGAYAHQDVPFEKLVEVLRPARDLSRHPIFQASFTLQNAQREALRLPDLTLRQEGLQRKTAKFDLTLDLEETAQGLRGVIEYATDLFDGATIERMAGHLRVLLEGIVANPDARISALPLLGAAERDQVLVRWNDTAADYPNDKCLHELFAEQAARTPAAVALVFGDQQLSYGELDRRSNQLARYLRRQGVGPDVVVGLCVERSFAMMVGLLGILKAGGAYLPLDPDYPQERLAFMASDAKVTVLLTQASLAGRLATDGAQMVRLDTDWAQIASCADGRIESGVRPDNLAYVIYTSGSTGRPKGVMLHHQGLANYLAYARQAYDADHGSGAPINTSISFDATVTSLFLPLVSGRAIWLLPDAQEIEALGRLLEARPDFSLVKLTPAHLEVLQWKLPAETLDGQTRAFVIGGEALTATAVKHWREFAPGTRLFNEYGPTEAVVGCVVHEVSAATTWTGSIPIGRPISNTQIYVLDGGFTPVPIGVAGELHIGGVGLARGYLGRPGLTAERFVPNPHGEGERLYRTGDLARWRADGELEFLGRIDHQVKLRGYRIELGEIETVLSRHPAVRQAVAVAREEAAGDKRLVAYVVADGTEAPEPNDLRAHLKQSLPDYMVPSAFVMLDALPLTPSGKVDRQALPAPEGRPAGEAEYVAPRTPTEEVLAAIWAEVLKLDRVGVHDNFFALGGHSLMAMRMAARLRESLGIELSLRAVFEAPVLLEFARRIDLAQGSGAGTLTPAVARTRRDGPLPLSFAQERIWVLVRLELVGSAYNIPVAVRLGGQLNVGALERAFAALVERHEVLRTHFEVVDGRPAQVIDEPGGFRMEVEDLSALPAVERDAAARERARSAAERPFDLGRDTLFRVSLLKLSATEHVVLVGMHHSVSDGWSMGILIREMGLLYAAFVQGQLSPLPALPVQYADYAIWQREWFQGEVLEQQLSYWKDRLRGIPAALELPTDRPRPATQSYRGGTREFGLSKELSAELLKLARREGATLFMVLLAAFQIVLSRWSGQTDVVVGTPTAGRTRQELEGLIGCFLNMLALRTDLSGDPGFRELLGRVKESTLGAFEHQDVPFEKLVEALQPVRDVSRQPVFQASFTLQNVPLEALHVPGLTLHQERDERTTAKLDLSLYLQETVQGIRGVIEYATDLFDGATIDRLAGHLRLVLEGIAANADARISALPLLGTAEREQILVRWNDTAADYPKDKCLHEVFAEQAACTPSAVAVMFEDQQLSYGELDRRSNQLAHYLRRQGVGPDVVVGLCVERSLEMVISLLGILKAGGAYLPLDPNYPQERLAFMLADSQVPIVVTEEKAVDILPVSWARIVCLDLEWTAIEAEPGEAPESGVEADNLAYMIYTSGSTGTPKGALLQHDGLCNLAAAQIAGFDVQADCRVLQFASLNFDASISEIAMALCAGATLCLTRDILSGDADLAGILTGLDITTVTLPPSVLPLLTGKDFPSLRTLVVAGEACPAEIAAYWASRCRLVNAYGPTEATVCATFGAYADAGTRLSIGRPMRNTRAYVLDEELSPAPIGITGELYVGGVGLARGYLGRPGLTAERFVPNPHGDGERLYRTGDLSRWRADGELEFLGRVDHQVKLRGYRIELGEIEAALSRNPAVRQAVVVAREEAEGDRRLVAYVVPQGEETPDVSQLRTHLKQSLPDYMVPAAFIMLEALPLNPSGKVDRLALPAQPNYELSKRHGIAPRNELEVNLVEIWERLLGVAPISVDDDFFELGGNSLLVIQLAHEMNKKNYSISPTSISRYPTIESLAQSIETNLASVSGDCIIQLKSGSPDRPLFLVHPVGGMASCYFELAKCVDLPRAIFGVNAPGLTGDTNIPTSIEAMAEYYIEAIRDMHPLGPYDVGGWSMGGVIAYEMARRLGEGSGERPAVVLIDTYFYSGAEIGEDSSDPEGLWHAFLDNLLLSGGEARPTIGRIHDSLGYRKERNGQDLMLRAREVLAEYSVIGSDVSERYLASMFDSYTTNLKAARRYVPGPYDGPILAITTEQPDRSVQRPGQAAPLQSGPRLERHHVSSDHFSLMRRPAAEMLGTSLTKFLSAHQT